jgi:hypothetical protein
MRSVVEVQDTWKLPGLDKNNPEMDKPKYKGMAEIFNEAQSLMERERENAKSGEL